jgi:hypothetical protein
LTGCEHRDGTISSHARAAAASRRGHAMMLPEGLIYAPGFLAEAEERDVLAVLATFELQPQFGDVSGISLLAACRMRFRRGRPRAWQTAELTLEPAPHTSCPAQRGHNGSTTSPRSRRSGGQ